MWRAVAKADQAVHDRGAGVATRYLVTAAAGAVGLLTGVTDFEPGAELPLHFHNCDEAITVLSGSGFAEVAGEMRAVAAGDAVWISEGTHHRFLARPDSPLQIHWAYARADATRTIVATGDTMPIGSARDRNY